MENSRTYKDMKINESHDAKLIEKYKKQDYEHSGRSLMAWETSAQALQRAATHLLEAHRRYRDAMRPFSMVAEGSPGWKEFNDFHLMPIYYLLIGYAVENYIKGIIIINHPEYITDEGLTKIDKHEMYDLLNENGITEFKEYDDILHQLSEYVISMGRYPITKRLDDYKTIKEPINIDRINRLLSDLYKRSKIEQRLEILRRKGDKRTFQEFMEVQKEIIAFITSEVSMVDIHDQYPQYSKDFIIQMMQNHAEKIADKKKRRSLLIVIERWRLGYDENKLGTTL